LWRIDRQTYRTIITHHNKETSDEFFGLVSNVHILGKRLGDVLSHAELSKVVSTLEIEEFEHDSVIIRQHQTGDYFYIISEGQVDVWQESTTPIADEINGASSKHHLLGNKLATLKRGDYFGEKALLADDVRQASCVAVGKVICLSLSRDDFIAMIGSWQDITNVNVNHMHNLAAKKAKIRESVYDSQYHISIHLDDLEQLNTLGVGAFGRVRVARHKATAQLYALKAQSKAFIVSQNMQEMILNEMHIMKQIDHPFISKLHASIQDKKFIYFLLELLPGGEFFSYLQTAGKLSEERSRFYSASVILGLEELHKNRIAYRDLKPENMVWCYCCLKMAQIHFLSVISLGDGWPRVCETSRLWPCKAYCFWEHLVRVENFFF
jgi:CRP-like cAMP-binding protein